MIVLVIMLNAVPHLIEALKHVQSDDGWMLQVTMVGRTTDTCHAELVSASAETLKQVQGDDGWMLQVTMVGRTTDTCHAELVSASAETLKRVQGDRWGEKTLKRVQGDRWGEKTLKRVQGDRPRKEIRSERQAEGRQGPKTKPA